MGWLGTGTSRTSSDDQVENIRFCPDATVRPHTVHYESPTKAPCTDEHPATKTLKQKVKTALRERYSTVGALIDAGYIPYFDFMSSETENGWSHWLNPAFIGNDSMVDPDRPESILVDHKWWRPIGVVFIATRDGEHVDTPPVVYREDDGARQCLPWHSHVGIPGRYAWWKYRLLYVDGFDDADRRLPCRTPWMMHVWAYPHPESVYAHDAPPRGNRGGPPAEPAGFETDATPGEDTLSWDVLPEMLRHKVAHR